MHYHQLSSKKLTIDDSKTVTSKLSKNASIKVTNQKNGKVSVSLFSGGKMLLQKTQTLRSGHYMVLAGKSTGDSAWVIVRSKSNYARLAKRLAKRYFSCSRSYAWMAASTSSCVGRSLGSLSELSLIHI